jgi:hypothetical protein
METQKFREALLDRAAVAFARDKLDEAGPEALIVRIQDAPGEAELREAEAYLAPLVPVAEAQRDLEEARDLALNMSNLKRQGDWVDARVYRLEGKMSNFELDYLSYADERGFSMLLKVDLSMSNLKLIVPPDWQVDCRITHNVASNVIDRWPAQARAANRIVVEGSLSMSNIKVKRRRPGRRLGFFAFLLGRP